MRRLAASLLLAGALGIHPSFAASVPSTAITQDGVHLSLSLPAGIAYPKRALVPVVVRATNISSRTLHTWDCLRDSLWVQGVGPTGVLAHQGVLPPPGAPWSNCPAKSNMGGMGMQRHMVTLRPGQTLTMRGEVVLIFLALHAYISLQVSPGQGKPTVVTTPNLHLHPNHLPGPRARLLSAPIRAQVTPAPGAGPTYYSQYASCRDKAYRRHPIRVSAVWGKWQRLRGTQLQPFTPTCHHLTEWSLFVAQLGRPLAHVYYCAQHNLCDYAPPTAQDRAAIACKRDVARAEQTGRLPHNVAVARYALGLTGTLPPGLTPTHRQAARSFHARCAPLMHRKP